MLLVCTLKIILFFMSPLYSDVVGQINVDQKDQTANVALDFKGVMPELYAKYIATANDGIFRRFSIHNKEYEIHVKKLREVNGYKKHNLLIKEQSDPNNPIIYVNNPVESKLPYTYLSMDEFKEVLTARIQRQRDSITTLLKETKLGLTRTQERSKHTPTRTNSLFRSAHTRNMSKTTKPNLTKTKDLKSDKKHKRKGIKKLRMTSTNFFVHKKMKIYSESTTSKFSEENENMLLIKDSVVNLISNRNEYDTTPMINHNSNSKSDEKLVNRSKIDNVIIKKKDITYKVLSIHIIPNSLKEERESISNVVNGFTTGFPKNTTKTKLDDDFAYTVENTSVNTIREDHTEDTVDDMVTLENNFTSNIGDDATVNTIKYVTNVDVVDITTMIATEDNFTTNVGDGTITNTEKDDTIADVGDSTTINIVEDVLATDAGDDTTMNTKEVDTIANAAGEENVDIIQESTATADPGDDTTINTKEVDITAEVVDEESTVTEEPTTTEITTTTKRTRRTLARPAVWMGS